MRHHWVLNKIYMKMKTARIILLLLSACVVAIQAQHLSYPVETIKGKPYYRYKVEKGIGLYRLSMLFSVTQEEILDANPQVKKKGLQYGTTILIPVAQQEKIELVQEEPVVQVLKEPIVVETDSTNIHADSLNLVDTLQLHLTDSIIEDTIVVNPKVVDRIIVDEPIVILDTVIPDTVALDTIRIAMMLPLQASATQRTVGMERFMDFYVGALIAIYEAQQADVFVELYTYDVGKQTSIEQLLSSDSWRPVDAIVGPAYRQQISQVAKFAEDNDVWMLVPFFSELEATYQHDKLLQFNPSSETEAHVLAQYLAANVDDVNCVLVHTKVGENIPKSIKCLHDAIAHYQIPTTLVSLRNVLQDSLSNVLVEGKENIIIFNTEKYANLTPVIPYLQRCTNTHRICLSSRYSWQEEDIDLPQLYTSIFLENPIASKEYKQVYQHYFENKPISSNPRYDLLGYDLTKHLLAILLASQELTVEELWLGTQSNIKYQPSTTHAGYENREIRVMRK